MGSSHDSSPFSKDLKLDTEDLDSDSDLKKLQDSVACQGIGLGCAGLDYNTDILKFSNTKDVVNFSMDVEKNVSYVYSFIRRT